MAFLEFSLGGAHSASAVTYVTRVQANVHAPWYHTLYVFSGARSSTISPSTLKEDATVSLAFLTRLTLYVEAVAQGGCWSTQSTPPGYATGVGTMAAVRFHNNLV